MNRRFFLRSMGAAAAVGALAQAEAFSFLARDPTSIIVPDRTLIVGKDNQLLTPEMVTREALRILQRQLNAWMDVVSESIVISPSRDHMVVRTPPKGLPAVHGLLSR